MGRLTQPGLGRRLAMAAHVAMAAVMALVLPVSAEEIVDGRGRRVALQAPAQRVVFLPMPAPSMYIGIDGSEKRIVGINPSSATAMRDGILGRFFPGAGSIATNITSGTGVLPNVEAILALQPDAVFQWANSGPEPIEVLDRAGLTILGMRYGSQDDMAGDIAMMGAVAGKPERAAEISQRQRERQAAIAGALADLPSRSKPRVLALSRASDSFRAAGAGSYNDFYIALAGGQNVAASGRAAAGALTLEQILAWDPEVVLLGNFDTVMPADLYGDPRWQAVTAVTQRRIYRLPLGGYRWDPPSLESALTWSWLAGLLHPDRARFDLRRDMREWYRFLYDHDLSDAEIDSILFVSDNGGSAGYDRYRAR
jgi:iron complex transport system substrate-binding protein